jgi:hypothetical protein
MRVKDGFLRSYMFREKHIETEVLERLQDESGRSLMTVRAATGIEMA